MNFHYPALPHFRPKANVYFLQELNKQRGMPLSADRKLRRSVGKVLLLLCPLLLVIHFCLATSFDTLQQSVHVLQSTHRGLMDSEMQLRAKRDQLLSPERVRISAAEKLALHVPDKEQIKIL